MMKTRVFIVRHTETIGNVEKRLTGRQDYEITERGQVLIQKLTKELEKIKFDRAYSSTSRRAIKTIEPIVEKQNLKIEESDELCEMYFGIYDGWKWEDVNKIQPEIKQTQNEINEIVGIPGQESMEETAKRMYNYIFKDNPRSLYEIIGLCQFTDNMINNFNSELSILSRLSNFE